MKWKIRKSVISGSIKVPPSKSHTIRALLFATLAEGVSHISGPLMSGDGASAILAAGTFGADICEKDNVFTVKGIAGNYDMGGDSFDMGNSGTSTNLFTSAVALGSRKRRIDGDASLRKRPVRPLLEALEHIGASYVFEADGRDLPFTVCGPLKGGRTKVDGKSSQFVSSLLVSCPLICSDTDIEVVNIHEIPYIEMTLWWLDKMGIRYERNRDFSHFHIYGGQKYNAFDIEVPGDFSSAAFPAVGAAIAGNGVTIEGIDFSDPQGDKRLFDILASMGADVQREGFSAVIGTAGSMKGTEIDLNSMPDALPAVAVLGCTAQNITRIVNVAHARIKETDRIKVMAQELSKMGARIEENPDGLTIYKSRLKGCCVNGHDDHRVVMALALAGMIAEGETVIDTAESAEVTYPGFVENFSRIGADISIL
jgi:3-phosphoshikimate 1-carboxyvinyltransferase